MLASRKSHKRVYYSFSHASSQPQIQYCCYMCTWLSWVAIGLQRFKLPHRLKYYALENDCIHITSTAQLIMVSNWHTDLCQLKQHAMSLQYREAKEKQAHGWNFFFNLCSELPSGYHLVFSKLNQARNLLSSYQRINGFSAITVRAYNTLIWLSLMLSYRSILALAEIICQRHISLQSQNLF